MVKARHHGAAYIYSLLTGYGEKPPAGFTIAKDKHFNPYFAGFNIGMPAPLTNNGVTFSDGTPATIDQQAKDVVTFLAWAAEPKMEQRKRMGFSVLLFWRLSRRCCSSPTARSGPTRTGAEFFAKLTSKAPDILRALSAERCAKTPRNLRALKFMAKTVLGIIGGSRCL